MVMRFFLKKGIFLFFIKNVSNNIFCSISTRSVLGYYSSEETIYMVFTKKVIASIIHIADNIYR